VRAPSLSMAVTCPSPWATPRCPCTRPRWVARGPRLVGAPGRAGTARAALPPSGAQAPGAGSPPRGREVRVAGNAALRCHRAHPCHLCVDAVPCCLCHPSPVLRLGCALLYVRLHVPCLTPAPLVCTHAWLYQVRARSCPASLRHPRSTRTSCRWCLGSTRIPRQPRWLPSPNCAWVRLPILIGPLATAVLAVRGVPRTLSTEHPLDTCG
jgi:hypothetical protein